MKLLQAIMNTMEKVRYRTYKFWRFCSLLSPPHIFMVIYNKTIDKCFNSVMFVLTTFTSIIRYILHLIKILFYLRKHYYCILRLVSSCEFANVRGGISNVYKSPCDVSVALSSINQFTRRRS